MRKFRDALSLRSDYMAAYTVLKSRGAHFVGAPRTRGGDRPRGWLSQLGCRLWGHAAGTRPLASAPDSYLIGKLRQAEQKLTLAQCVTYRTMVALQHSRYVLSHASAATEYLAMLDMLNVFVDAHPTLEDDDEAAVRTRVSVLTLVVECPRIGVRAVTSHSLSEDLGGWAQWVRRASAGAGGASCGAGAPPGRARPVVELLVQNIMLSIPDSHHVAGWAETVRIGSSLDMPGDSVTLQIPASPEALEAHTLKFDSTAGRNHGSGAGGSIPGQPGTGGAGGATGSRAASGTHSEAPVSAYLPRVKLSLAPIELNAIAPCASVGVAFVDEFLAVVASAGSPQQGLNFGRGGSLGKDVRDSYVRHGVKVPISLSSLPPKLTITCPVLLIRAPTLINDHDNLAAKVPDLPDRSGVPRTCVLVASVTRLLLSTRYVSTVYGEMTQSMTVLCDLEVVFQINDNSSPTFIATQVWLHPADVALFQCNLATKAGNKATGCTPHSLRASKPFIPLLKAKVCSGLGFRA
ncbi:hypothetical protein FOA52_012521 [Chlamydomonas sp. UWO 241]|nr:hypothetical protein FOA52_012521 [Chlamydomonas sp. UWO 241]